MALVPRSSSYLGPCSIVQGHDLQASRGCDRVWHYPADMLFEDSTDNFEIQAREEQQPSVCLPSTFGKVLTPRPAPGLIYGEDEDDIPQPTFVASMIRASSPHNRRTDDEEAPEWAPVLSDTDIMRHIERHEKGDCKPCFFWYYMSCTKGSKCAYCHIKHPKGEYQMLRQQGANRHKMRSRRKQPQTYAAANS